MLLSPGSISSTFENLDLPNVEAMGELSNEFRQYHYLSGLVLSELAGVLDGRCEGREGKRGRGKGLTNKMDICPRMTADSSVDLW